MGVTWDYIMVTYNIQLINNKSGNGMITGGNIGAKCRFAAKKKKKIIKISR